jgi:uncharacterized protein
MSRNYPDRVRPEKVASAKRRFAGKMALIALDQVTDLMEEPGSEDGVAFEVQFDHDGQGQIVADLHIEGLIPLLCQRSLRRFLFPVDSRARIGIVSSEEAAAQLPDDYEPLVCADDDLELKRLVEEELMLALPIVPVDPDAPPNEAVLELDDGLPAEPTHSPFEALAKLKKKQ